MATKPNNCYCLVRLRSLLFVNISRTQAGEHFRRTLLAPGGSLDAMESYRTFRGGDPDLAHLLERIGAE